MPAEHTTRIVASLTPGQATAVVDLARAATEADGVNPLSEAFRLALGPPRDGVTHILRYAAWSPPAPGATPESADHSVTDHPVTDRTVADRAVAGRATTADRANPTHDAAGRLVGYAQVAGDAAELLVAPQARGRGHGGELVTAALTAGARGFWAHGDLPAARSLGARFGLEPVRSLHRMTRVLTEADRGDLDDPAGLGFPSWVTIGTFAQRPDVAVLQRLNATAFAAHPEQGRLTVADLRERMAEPWFDPAGLFLLHDENAARDADPVGFHWTKAVPGSVTGEVYVVGIHPAYRGRGLAGPLTRLGLAHLANLGRAEVELYVDGENTPAVATYRRLGFEIAQTHVVHHVRPGAAPERT